MSISLLLGVVTKEEEEDVAAYGLGVKLACFPVSPEWSHLTRVVEDCMIYSSLMNDEYTERGNKSTSSCRAVIGRVLYYLLLDDKSITPDHLAI